MRIVVDLQGTKSQSSFRSIEKYSLLLAQAIVRNARVHEIIIVISDRSPDTITFIRHKFNGLVPKERIVVFSMPEYVAGRNPGNNCRARTVELIREYFLQELRPDVVLITSLFKGLSADTFTSIQQFDTYCVASVVFAITKTLLDTKKKSTWDKLARKIIQEIDTKVVRKKKPVVTTTIIKPKLAFISPLPPEKSGISYYSAELLPHLVKYYDIELIVDQPCVDNAIISNGLPIRNVNYFIAQHEKYERIIYQFGNSLFHKHMFNLLEKYPGVVVLHDFGISDILHWLENSGYAPGAFRKGLYESHGYNALVVLQNNGTSFTIKNYPCSKTIIESSAGVIVHSKYALEQASKWYGPAICEDMVLVPPSRTTNEDVNRSRARKELGISNNVFLICSFGHLNYTKLNHRLLDAFLSSLLSKNKKCRLVFVGHNNADEYGQSLLDKIKKSGRADNIRITGFVNHEVYTSYLSAADVAVQLRTESRGETSRAVLDVLASGLPLIINAHGSMAEYQDDILFKISDKFTDEEMTSSLEKLWHDEALRRSLSESGRRYIKKNNNPKSIAKKYFEVIENFHKDSAVSKRKNIVDAIVKNVTPFEISDQDLMCISKSIAANTVNRGLNTLFIDVSTISRNDLKTGIERVTKSILIELIKNPPIGFCVEPVYARDDNYYYARKLTFNLLGINEMPVKDQIIDVSKGDIFLGLDWAPDTVEKNKDLLKTMKNYGVAIHFVVYDILPITNPEWFPSFMAAPVANWLKTISNLADSCICISKATADSLKHWLDINNTLIVNSSVKWFHIGANIAQDLSGKGIPKKEMTILNKIKQRSSFLMVGTIEPRKMHWQVLKAFEILWLQDVEVNLVIVGHEGWKNVPDSERSYINDLLTKIKTHPEMNKKLFWLNDVSDDYLLEVYKASSALIAASGDEGFGLPLIEAVQHKLPIIARDIPVFCEVAGEHAYYFANSTEPQVISDAIITWLEQYVQNKHPKSDDIPRLTWAESAKMLLDRIMEKTDEPLLIK